ncbi:MAG: hypothetical protein JXN64_04660 [Spirochaetes bacterium]|nr:hypothetical protein [Spirochaetota bacterium]
MRIAYAISVISLIFLMSCSSGEIIKTEQPIEDTPALPSPADDVTAPELREREYNFVFTGYDINIDDPAWDRRSYYRIYIDKIDAGRTTIGLESQKKTFESKISSNNRHLVIVEKWVLDEKKGQYVKLNNIEQPKPGYLYFDMPDNKTAVVTLKNDPLNNKSEFELEFE